MGAALFFAGNRLKNRAPIQLEGFELSKTEYQSTVGILNIIQTQPKVGICAKLDPKTGGCQTWNILPRSQIESNYRYVSGI